MGFVYLTNLQKRVFNNINSFLDELREEKKPFGELKEQGGLFLSV